jgi:hypothetical protein
MSSAGFDVVSHAAGTSPPKPTGIVVAASTDNSGLGGAVPDVLVDVGSPFTLTVTLEPAGAEFNTATRLNLTPSLFSGAQPSGTFSPASVEMPAGVNSSTFSVSYSAVDNGVMVTAAVAKKSLTVTPGTTLPFDVLKTLSKFAGDDPRLPFGLGVGNANCTQATTESECGTVVLSHGLPPSQAGALSLGACTPDLGCTPGSQVVQFIADLGGEYTEQDPALLIIRCSKALCPGKAIKSYPVKLSFAASGPLNLVAAPCVSKGVALDAAGKDYCLDLVQSHRDNVGAALLYLLFRHDMRGST